MNAQPDVNLVIFLMTISRLLAEQPLVSLPLKYPKRAKPDKTLHLHYWFQVSYDSIFYHLKFTNKLLRSPSALSHKKDSIESFYYLNW